MLTLPVLGCTFHVGYFQNPFPQSHQEAQQEKPQTTAAPLVKAVDMAEEEGAEAW